MQRLPVNAIGGGTLENLLEGLCVLLSGLKGSTVLVDIVCSRSAARGFLTRRKSLRHASFVDGNDPEILRIR